MKDQPYPSYKNSNVWWLGDIPSHWKIVRLKYCVNSIIGGGTPESTNDRFWSNNEEGIPWVKIGDMTKNSVVLKTERYLTKEGLESKGLQIFPVGTFLYSIFASLGKVAILGIRAAVNQAILGIEPDTRVLLRDFLKYWMNSIERNIILFSSSNTQDNLTKGKVRLLPIYIPPLQEQKEIISFLDGKIQKVDALIKRKKHQIEVIQDKRAALISHIITKGLDPDAPMKDSSIQWLGKIPKHWNIQRLKYTVKLINENVDELKTDLPYIGLEHIESRTGKLLTQEMQTIDGKSKIFRTGDVLFGKLRPYLAKVIRTTFNGQCTGELLVMRPKLTIQDYLFYYILSRDFIDIVNSSTYGAKMPRANWEFIGSLPLLLPPETEQNTITEFLDRETKYIDKLVMNVQNSIDKLLEYRLSLISACVTGKIDVRKEVA